MDAAAEGARRLAAGEVIGFPTETVYGLGADATNVAAVRRIFTLKGRPADHPLIVHFADPAALARLAADVSDAARALAREFWPGPLTMILRKSASIPDVVTGGQDTVGLRCPSHSLAQDLLREFARIGSGLVAAPSANRFGHVSPTTAQHVREEFSTDLYVIDGGACEVGLESTIVDLSRGPAVLLRPGAITRQDLERVLGARLAERDPDAPRAPGTLAAHYAPRTPLAVLDPESLAVQLGRGAEMLAVLAVRPQAEKLDTKAWITASPDPRAYGRDLYANLRALDRSGARRILVESPPRLAAWEAVNDRLARAAAGGGIFDDEP